MLDLMEELEETVDEVLATSEVSTEPCRNGISCKSASREGLLWD